MQFTVITNLMSVIDNGLGCVCLWWAVGDELIRAWDIALYDGQDNTSTGEYYVTVSFSSIGSTIQILRANISILPLTSALPCPLQLFYINRLLTTNGLQIDSASNNSESSHTVQ